MGGPRPYNAGAANAAYQAIKNDLSTKVQGDKTVDDLTKQELVAGLAADARNGAEIPGLGGIKNRILGYDEAVKTYEDAKAGVGIYGVRRKNQEMAKIMLSRPGERQTRLSQGPSSNNATSGLLTGVQS